MSQKKLRKDFDDDEVQELYLYLLENTTNGKLRRGAVQDAADKFGVHVRTVGRIRAKVKSCKDSESVVKSLKKAGEVVLGIPSISLTYFMTRFKTLL